MLGPKLDRKQQHLSFIAEFSACIAVETVPPSYAEMVGRPPTGPRVATLPMASPSAVCGAPEGFPAREPEGSLLASLDLGVFI
jgi:hypothetical protein